MLGRNYRQRPPDKNRLLGWTQGVRLHELVDAEATGLFQGRRYRGSNLTLIELPNLIPQEFEDWALDELSQLKQKGCNARWDLVASTHESHHPKMYFPLVIELEKPRLFRDTRWLNLMYRHSSY